ncbi:MAG: hypothetical protein ACI8TQ_003171 [Planctomycetota bacterium]
MSSSEDRTAAAAGALTGTRQPGASLEQVRDLLCGNELDSLDRRTERLEERITRELNSIRADMKQRLDSMQRDLAVESELNANNFAEEREERDRRDVAITGKLTSAAAAVETRLEELRDEAAAAHDELRVSALEEVEGIREELMLSRKEDQKRLARMFAQMARFLDEGATKTVKRGE